MQIFILLCVELPELLIALVYKNPFSGLPLYESSITSYSIFVIIVVMTYGFKYLHTLVATKTSNLDLLLYTKKRSTGYPLG